MALYDTAGTIINVAAAECGLAPVADPYASTDPNFIQLQAFLRSAGRELRALRNWTKLQKIWVFPVVANTSNYALPSDFLRAIPNTGWNRTKRLPIGTLTAQDYEFLKGRVVGVLFTIMQRQLQGQYVIYPDGASAPTGDIIAYEYLSRYWVVPTGTAGPSDGCINWFNGAAYSTNDYVDAGGNIWQCAAGGTSGTHCPIGSSGTQSDGALNWNFVSASGSGSPAASDDLVLLDSPMISKRLKLMFLAAKGLPSDAAMDEFQTARDSALEADVAQRAIYVTGNYVSPPVLDRRNIPETGFGL